MRKKDYFTILSAFIFLLTGCTEDDDLAFVNESNIDAQTEAFFNHELEHYNTFFFEEWPNCDTLLIINSEEEFKRKYQGAQPLPYIDFSNNTLIIGCVFLPQPDYYIRDAKLEQTPEGYAMIVNVDRYENVGVLCMNYNAYFWKVYPKLQNDSIIITTNNVYKI